MATVLVVDDELDLRLLVRVILERAGHTVVETSSGAEGLERLEAGGIDLTLLDIRLPDIGGIEVLGKVKEQDPSAPVLVLTAHSSGHVREAATQAGCDAYLSKPFDRREFLEVVERLLG